MNGLYQAGSHGWWLPLAISERRPKYWKHAGRVRYTVCLSLRASLLPHALHSMDDAYAISDDHVRRCSLAERVSRFQSDVAIFSPLRRT